MPKCFYEKLDRLTRRSFLVNDDVKTGLAAALEAKSSSRRHPPIEGIEGTTSKPPPPDRKVEDAINLPNIFHNKTLRSTHKNVWIIALDPGATCIAGAVAFDSNHPDQRRNLAVTTKCLAEPERRYRNWQEANKLEEISTAERECTRSHQETWAESLRRFVTSYDVARAYYSTKKYKRKRWDAGKAKRGELDRVLEGNVKMVGESMGHKLSGGKKVIVAIGMGDFSSAKSCHVMFIRYLIRKLRPLGYTIVGVNEYYTSTKYPCCKEFVRLKSDVSLVSRIYMIDAYSIQPSIHHYKDPYSPSQRHAHT
ncbi:hypothetical protein SeLEV6574_g01338 [Synchytrium endobioticum]|uniref:Uncharacterized protein n=1 Tax=Synchytrium endobioticum TaxID=286115 RepID=A0A507DDC4_9FUNG|nr:hypothetical protein SeLEV6574_g01338 [Synchytrium endobioticum]